MNHSTTRRLAAEDNLDARILLPVSIARDGGAKMGFLGAILTRMIHADRKDDTSAGGSRIEPRFHRTDSRLERDERVGPPVRLSRNVAASPPFASDRVSTRRLDSGGQF